ncbi:LysE family translocator [Psychroflexus sp. ALD_RP9]|uniref:LysE family translocator n=1 Tax=Psychroflexus sp. ALD_RP9 TaxID=2777186 RepID=UPI001A8DCF3B|nr:LysE family translocator [Psychroflexus sp. ALD_RP9]QSS96488.1 LysE family translocator [Psychroflexus sp. ALD_RP9]
MLAQLSSFLLASILLTLAPGPDIIFVLSQSIAGGFKRGVIIAAGLVSGIIFHTSLLAFGVSTLLIEFPQFFFTLKLIGAGYLVYLAYQVYKSPSSEIKLSKSTKSLNNYFKKGLIMNLINPKVSLFFLAFFPGFLWNETQNTIFQFYLLGAVFMLQAFVIFSLVAFFSDRLAQFLKHQKHFGDIMKYFQIISFLLIAVLILV